jgi:hypothetical protein
LRQALTRISRYNNKTRWWRTSLGLPAARPFLQMCALDDAIRPRKTTLLRGNWPPPRSLASTTIQIRRGGFRIPRRKSTRADRITPSTVVVVVAAIRIVIAPSCARRPSFRPTRFLREESLSSRATTSSPLLLTSKCAPTDVEQDQIVVQCSRRPKSCRVVVHRLATTGPRLRK